MRVAIISPYVSFVEVNMAAALEKHGIDCWIITSEKPRFDYRRSAIAFETWSKTIELPSVLDNRLLGNYAPFPILPNLSTIVRRLNVDIVNTSEYPSFPTWLLSIVKKGWKTVLTQHGLGIRHTFRDLVYEYGAQKLLISRIDAFAALGLRGREFLERLGARDVAVIPNPIDETVFRPVSPYEDREDLVLFVGRVDTRRRLDLLLNAMREVKQQIATAKLLVIGDEGNLSMRLPRDDWLKYLGPRSHLEMPRYYNLAKVLVDPVRGEAGCGCAVEESLACGTPIVGTTDLDFPFDWRDGEVGYLVEPNKADLTMAIIQALENGTKLHANCRELGVREFGLSSVGAKYSQVFEHVLRR